MRKHLKILVALLPTAEEQYEGLLEIHRELLEQEPKRL